MEALATDVHNSAMEKHYAGSKNSGHKYNQTKWDRHFSNKHGMTHKKAKELVHRHFAKKSASYTPDESIAGM